MLKPLYRENSTKLYRPYPLAVRQLENELSLNGFCHGNHVFLFGGNSSVLASSRGQ